MKRFLFCTILAVCECTALCEPLSEISICKHYLDYADVFIPDESCQDKLEYEVESLPMTLALFNNYACQEAVGVWVCSKTFKRCGSGGLQNPCHSLMRRVLEECTADHLTFLSLSNPQWDVMKDLEANITDNCNQPQNQHFSPTVNIPRCEKYTGKLCSGVIDYNLYVPAGYSQDGLEQQLYDFSLVLSFVDNAKCLDTLLDFLCSMTFMPCESVFISELPQYPCHSLCLKAMDECASLFGSNEMLAQVKMNCSARGAYIAPAEKKLCGEVIRSAQPDFPLQKFVFKSVEEVGVEIASKCNPGASSRLIEGQRVAPIDAYSAVSCPNPLVKVPIGSGLYGGSCKDPCPSFVITSDEWDVAETIFNIFSPLSFIFSLFVFLTWVIFPKTRKHSSIIYVVSNTLAISVAELLGVFYSRNGKIRNISCSDHANTWGQSGSLSYCVIQAFVFFYCSNSAVAWWFLQALDLYNSVVHQIFKKVNKKTKIRYYMAWGFVWPLVATIIMLGLGAFGGTGAMPWCFVKPEYDDWTWSLLHYPILAQGFLVCYIIFRVLRSLWKSHLKTSYLRRNKDGSKSYGSAKKWKQQVPTRLELTSSNGQQSSHGSPPETPRSTPRSSSPRESAINFTKNKKKSRLHKSKSRIQGKDLEYFIRPLLFVCIFWILYVSFSTYAAITYLQMDDYIQSSTEFMTCIFSGGRPTMDSCGTVPSTRQPMGMWFYLIFVGSAQGFVVFLLYGTMPRNINLWKGLLSGHGLSGFKPESKTKSSQKSRSSEKTRARKSPRPSDKVTNKFVTDNKISQKQPPPLPDHLPPALQTVTESLPPLPISRAPTPLGSSQDLV